MAKKWTSEEIKLLEENYPYMDCNELFKLFKGNRSKDCIESKSSHMKLKKFKKHSKEGYQFCKKCNRELPLDFKYFPKVMGEKNFRQVCRECSSHYKGFLEDDYKIREYWSEDEEIKFVELYPYYTNEELRELFYPNLSDKQLSDKAWSIGVSKNEDTVIKGHKQQGAKASIFQKGRIKSDETRRKLSETKKRQYAEGVYISPWLGRVVSEEEKEKTRQRVKGKWLGENNPRHINPLKGSDNGRWEGGITNLYQFLRENIVEWKEDSMKFCNYKCVLTGDYFNNIHHLIPFKDIVYEAMSILNIEVKQDVSDYSEELRKELINKIKELHIKHGNGICLTKDLHKIFHDNYGYTNFTKENFVEFTSKYFNQEFDELLIEKHRSINSKSNYKEGGINGKT